MDLFLSTIKKQYDRYSEKYYHDLDNSMQMVSLKKLVDYTISTEQNISNKIWLDAGCGPGSLSKIRNQFSPKSVTGIDLSEGMVHLAKRSGFYDACNVGDITNLNFLKNQSFDIYFSNSVFHWLNIVGQGRFRKSLEEAYRVLKPQGLIALSLSGIGTAQQMIAAYKEMVAKFQKINPLAIDTNCVYDDVLGSENLFEVVDLFEETGFDVKLAKLEFEPVLFKHPSDYVKAVEKYGKHIYLLPFRNFKIKQQDKVFEQIGKNFVDKIGDRTYKHHQYVIYIIGKKIDKFKVVDQN